MPLTINRTKLELKHSASEVAELDVTLLIEPNWN